MNYRNVLLTNYSINRFICVRIALIDPCLLVLLNLHEDSQWPWHYWVPIFTSFFLSLYQTSWCVKLCDRFKSSRYCCDLRCFDHFFLFFWFLVLFDNTVAHCWPYWLSLPSIPFSLYYDLLLLLYFYFWHGSLINEFLLSSEWFLLYNFNFWASSWFRPFIRFWSISFFNSGSLWSFNLLCFLSLQLVFVLNLCLLLIFRLI